MAKKLVVGITQGDGNGIGYEVISRLLLMKECWICALR